MHTSGAALDKSMRSFYSPRADHNAMDQAYHAQNQQQQQLNNHHSDSANAALPHFRGN
jgi:hypothetical protein